MNGRPERIGPYEVVGLLGDGGMGRVYRARDPRFDRMVAVKVLQPHLASSPELARRFTAEAVIQAKLRHPNIVAVHDFVADGETLAIVMEFIDGRSLEKVISDAGGPLTPERCVALMSQVLSAMAYAHEQGLVHRDVKPSNIVVETIRGEEHAKVVDFGIAKILGDDKLRTATGAKMGTLAYMSPEQVKSPKNVDARSDIYSLGVVLYEMLTGRTPFDADSEYELMDRIVREEPPVPSRVIQGSPPSFDAVVRRAMAKRPEDRYSDCEGFRKDLQRATEGLVAVPDRVVSARSPAIAFPLVSAQTSVQAGWSFLYPHSGTPRHAGAAATRKFGMASLLLGLVAAAVFAGSYFAGSSSRERKKSEAVAVEPRAQAGPEDAERQRIEKKAGIASEAAAGTTRERTGAVVTERALAEPLRRPVSATAALGATAVPRPTPPARRTSLLPSSVRAATEVPIFTPAPRLAIHEGTGKAFFRSNVYAVLTVDGEKGGRIPPGGIELESIPTGRHRAVFSVAGFMTLEKDFEVKAGQTTDVKAEFPARGLLQVAVNVDANGAEVLVDGKPVGVAPLKKTIAAGPHRIEVRHPGFEMAGRDVVVPEDDTVKAPFELRKK